MPFHTTLLFCFLSLSGFAQNGNKLGVVPLNSGKRVALVIGNMAYENIRPLKNTERDADSVTAILRKVNFDVKAYKNLNLRGMQEVLSQFLTQLDKSRIEAVVFYFSGHGIGIGQTNYLLPADVRFDCIEQPNAYDSVSLNRVVERILAKEIETNLFFVDACRSLDTLTRCNGTMNNQIWQGLAKPSEKYRRSLIAFATQEGHTADDDTFDKVNSLFTAELVRFINLPNTGVRKVLDLTNQEVFARSKGKQDPVRSDHLLGDFVFIRKDSPPLPESTRRIDVVAYQPNTTTLDMRLAKLVVQELKE